MNISSWGGGGVLARCGMVGYRPVSQGWGVLSSAAGLKRSPLRSANWLVKVYILRGTVAWEKKLQVAVRGRGDRNVELGRFVIS